MIYIVTAVAIDHELNISPPREEEIDTETNELFHEATGAWDVEDRYEAFWNRLNDSWEHDFPTYKERIKVLSVRTPLG